MDRSLAIIGAGVAGLSAGIYAARSGYRTTILEMGALPGGLCTSWTRKGYRFDGSAAGLAGTAAEAPIHALWKDLGVIDYCPLHDPDSFGSLVLEDGRTITVWTDIDRLERHLLQEFPRDRTSIEELAHALRACCSLEIPYRAATGRRGAGKALGSLRSMLSSLPTLLKYGSITLRAFVERLQDPAFATVARNLVHFGGLDVPLLTVLLPIAYAHRRMTGMPRDGWLSFARAMERRFVELGGEVRYRSQVTSLIAEDGRVRGVRLADGSEVRADRVLSAADGHFTRTVLLGEDRDRVEKRFAGELLSDQPVQVSLGVRGDWSGLGGPLTLLTAHAPVVAGRPQPRVTIHAPSHDPGAAPAGGSAMIAFLDSDYGFWKALEKDPESYRSEKTRCADFVISAIERYRPGFSATVEVRDVATPLSRERYTGNRWGAMQARKPDASMVKALLQGGTRYDWPGLEGFWMAGQWVEAWGGITTAAQSGRKALMAMCRRDRVQFDSKARRPAGGAPRPL